MRWAAKRDANEPEIVKALERAGWLVMKVSDKGAPDLLCAKKGRLVLVEVKGPKGKLTPAQEEAHAYLAAAGVTVHVVTTPEEALIAVGAPVEGVLEPLGALQLMDADVRRSIAAYDAERGHVVTPAYQREQTEAVVPKKRTQAGDQPHAATPCACGHRMAVHTASTGPCHAFAGCSCSAFTTPTRRKTP